MPDEVSLKDSPRLKIVTHVAQQPQYQMAAPQQQQEAPMKPHPHQNRPHSPPPHPEKEHGKVSQFAGKHSPLPILL